MKVIDFECRDYETAAKLHAGDRSGVSRYRSRTKVCYGTYIVRVCWIEDEPVYRIELHGHTIVSFHHDGRIFVDGHRQTFDTDNPNGWWTLTTKKRINACLPVGQKLYQKRKQWHLSLFNGAKGNDVVFFHDGLNVGQFVQDRPQLSGISKAVTSI